MRNIKHVDNSQVHAVFHQQLDHVPGPVHDLAHLLETAVSQGHAAPLQDLWVQQNMAERKPSDSNLLYTCNH